eukprot:c24539_g1_i1.p1 GENE.c24539_g1_i1~~c24539_g1_i1.p1  ORF type:complete len:145 (+),score=68.12 c24539_g1_i1:22-435(+)
MSDYDKVVKGKLSLKGLDKDKEKKKNKKSKRKIEEVEQNEANETKEKKVAKEEEFAPEITYVPGGSAKNKTYEDLFPHERERYENGRVKTLWGSSYRDAPEILHGYSEPWRAKAPNQMSVEERLDLRSAKKADRYCK